MVIRDAAVKCERGKKTAQGKDNKGEEQRKETEKNRGWG